ncbi:MAG: type I DNA topoisomerase [Dehalococcoidia bacterium]|nr:type I DNA topoisomerase [Dehalococcoidia bacterium]MDW8119583.1 type I DNA topoisomerase [Chloroflexota bacterium]
MPDRLVIVESPAKARTLAHILGTGYVVKASKGHVRDLPKDRLGVEIANGFEPTYVTLPDKRPVIQEVQRLARDAEAVYLATDPDREGEAIAWHLVQAARLDPRKVRRVAFHEITEQAVREAFRHPRPIDMHLVEAQQARRILDRLVGYTLSPFLWQKIWRGPLSAGRVQSAALRLVVEREREILAFVPQEYWTLTAHLRKRPQGAVFTARLFSRLGEKERLPLPNEETTQRIVHDLQGAHWQVAEVRSKEVHQKPPPPFITSTLQQEAWRKLRMSARQTMLIAQQLYEGVPLGDQGAVGLITYMRTDSPHVAETAQQEARGYIRQRWGANYLPPSPRAYTSKVKGAQEAHEAIRPTSVHRDPSQVKDYLTPDQFRLYDLIWKRFVASQMADAVLDTVSVDIHARTLSGTSYLFRASGSTVKFLGFRTVYEEGKDEPEEEAEGNLPSLQKGELLDCTRLEPVQHFTQPPPRYTEASLIKALEERGIGRPSTYAPTVSTIQERGYVRRENGRLVPTPLGFAVNDLLVHYFPDIVDYNFTAQMEEDLDAIAEGKRQRVEVLKAFYQPFARDLEQAKARAQRVDISTGEICAQCGRPMLLRRGRYGLFLSCSGYPHCRNAKPYQVRTGAVCPQCGGDLVERKARRGKGKGLFYGCSNYPTCAFATHRRPLPQPCPECGGLVVAARGKRAECLQCAWKGPVPEGEPVPALEG